MLVTHQNPYSFSSSLTNFLPTFPPLFFRPIILTRCLYCKSFFFLGESLYCKSCFPFTFLFKLIGQKCQLKRLRVKREKTKSYIVLLINILLILMKSLTCQEKGHELKSGGVNLKSNAVGRG